MIAEAIFTSKIRYGVALFLKPVFDNEELKMQKLPDNTRALQVIQNDMIRTIFGLKIQNCINMKHIREKYKLMSVNQMTIYHSLLEAYNVMKNSSSEQIQLKWTDYSEHNYFLKSGSRNDVKVPKKPQFTRFSYNGSKLFNMLPISVREEKNPKKFKTLTKIWIWNQIPSF